MARSRNKATKVTEAPNPNETLTKEKTKMANVLDNDKIGELLATSKQRGVYEDELRTFVASEERGVQVDLTSGALEGKKAQSVKTGFENAKKKLEEDVAKAIRVIHNEDNVYLINTAIEA